MFPQVFAFSMLRVSLSNTSGTIISCQLQIHSLAFVDASEYTNIFKIQVYSIGNLEIACFCETLKNILIFSKSKCISSETSKYTRLSLSNTSKYTYIFIMQVCYIGNLEIFSLVSVRRFKIQCRFHISRVFHQTLRTTLACLYRTPQNILIFA